MQNERGYWLDTMDRICRPVMASLAEGQLKATMPVERKSDDELQTTYLQALGRTLVGIAPWLELSGGSGEEQKLRETYRAYAVKSIEHATDPDSPDFMNFTKKAQPIVDAAFLAEAILRAPDVLWHSLSKKAKANLAVCLKGTRSRKPGFNNWLLFSATIESALRLMGEDWDRMRVDYALRQHEQWFVGDGTYSDGPQFHWDYYNSFVIHPMMLDVIIAVGDESPDWAAMKPAVIERAVRYGEVLERMISPEGAFPPIGRSLAYRFGAFHALAQLPLLGMLSLPSAQVRCALSAVIRRIMAAPGNFDEHGWLTVGFCGHQPDIGERYISTGSLYLCTAAFLPLGLGPEDEFWTGADMPWTAKQIWGGVDMLADHAR